jgi:hypothetical protein
VCEGGRRKTWGGPPPHNLNNEILLLKTSSLYRYCNNITLMVSKMRAKTQVHVEYEVFNAILDSEAIGELILDLKQELVPQGDKVAEKRFNEGVKSASGFISNLLERRTHRLPEDHKDFKVK